MKKWKSRKMLEVEIAELESRVNILQTVSRIRRRSYEKQTAKCEQLEAENKALHEKLEHYGPMVRQFLDLMEMGDCNCCAKNRTDVCAYVPRPGEPTRLNCPHFTKVVIGK